MRQFRCTEPYEFIALYQEAPDKEAFMKEVSLFATHDYGSLSSYMMDYQQAAMQFIKDCVEAACGEPTDLF